MWSSNSELHLGGLDESQALIATALNILSTLFTGALLESLAVLTVPEVAGAVEFIELSVTLIFTARAGDFFALGLVVMFNTAFEAVTVVASIATASVHDGLLILHAVAVIASASVITAVSSISAMVTVVSSVSAMVTTVPVAGVTTVVTSVPVPAVVRVLTLSSALELILDLTRLPVVAFRELGFALLKSTVTPVLSWVAEEIAEDAVPLLIIKFATVLNAALLGVLALIAVVLPVKDALVVVAKDVFHQALDVELAVASVP